MRYFSQYAPLSSRPAFLSVLRSAHFSQYAQHILSKLFSRHSVQFSPLRSAHFLSIFAQHHYKCYFFLRYDIQDLIEEEEEDEDDDDSDPDWYQTPLLRRIKKISETTLHPAAAGTKRKLGETFTENDTPEENEIEGPKPKKRSGSSILGGCACKTGCKTKRCACVKNHKICTDACKCPLVQCENRKDRDHHDHSDHPDQSALSDISNSTAGTMSLLNDTYQIPMIKEENERKITPPSLNFDENFEAPKKLEVKESMFKSPLSAKTPPSLMQKRNSMFPSPLRD